VSLLGIAGNVIQPVGTMPNSSQERSVSRLLQQQAALADFGSFAFREASLHRILSEAARICAEGLGVPFCKICRYREAENELFIEAGFGWQDGVVGLVVSRADESSPQGRAYITGHPVIIPNLNEASALALPGFYAQHGITSTVDVLIKGLNGEPYGVLEIDSPVPHLYDRHDVDFLTGFANVLAEAVATAGRNAALSQAMEQLQAAVAEKDRLLEEKSIFAVELKHRVRNNLQLVQAMLTSHLKLETGATEQASIHGIIRRVMTLSEVYEQLLGTGLGRTIDLGEYLKALCASLPGLQADPYLPVELRCQTISLPVSLDTVTAIGMVVAELVSNSYEHAFTRSGGLIEVTLRRTEAASEALLSVSDDGAGFVEQPGSKRHGVGLVRRLLEQVHGSAELQAGPGTAWLLRFPVLRDPG
jgi:two-component sensor histidine kinase